MRGNYDVLKDYILQPLILQIAPESSEAPAYHEITRIYVQAHHILQARRGARYHLVPEDTETPACCKQLNFLNTFCIQHATIPHLALIKLLQTVHHSLFGQRKKLNHRLDSMQTSKVQHPLVNNLR